MNALFNMLVMPLRMLRFYWKNYSLIGLQMAAGAAVIYSSLTVYSSIQYRYDEMQNEIKKTEWDLLAYRSGESTSPPLRYDQYQQLRQKYSDAQFPLHFVYPVYYPNENNELTEAYFVYASDAYIKLFARLDAAIESSDKAYIGESIKEALQNRVDLLTVYPRTPAYRVQDNSLYVEESIHYPLQSIEQLNSEPFSIRILGYGEEEDKMIPADQIVLLPLTAMYTHYHPQDQGTFRLSVLLKDDLPSDEATDLIMQIIGQLFNWNGAEYSYQVSTQLQRFLLEISVVRDTAVIAAIIAAVCLVLVTLGLTGLIHLLFNRRKQGFAILIAMGAQRKQLLAGLMLEAVYPALIGCMVGILGSYYYLPAYVQLKQVDIHQSADVMLITMCCSLLPIVLAIQTLYFRVRNLKPVEILSRE